MPGPSSEITISTVSLSPPGIHLNDGAREVDGVLQNIADAVENLAGLRMPTGSLGAGNRDPNLDIDAEVAVRRDAFLDQGRQRHAVERRAGGRQLRDLGENVATALGLLAQQT